VEDYYTIEQVAKHYQVSVSTVRSWVRTGVIPEGKFIQIGKTYRFKISEVDAALRAHNAAKQAKLDAPVNATADQDI
jgi:excisionase family DNA binding protein